jgi:hypothetical protein
VGDTLINAYVGSFFVHICYIDTRYLSYYVLRNDMLAYFVNDIIERLATRQESDGWQVRTEFTI